MGQSTQGVPGNGHGLRGGACNRGTGGGKTARPGLHGGRWVTGVPTVAASLTFEDDRFAYGEQRFITLGLLRGRVVVIAHTEHEDEVHIISMREGTKREQTTYFRSLTD